MTRPSCKKVGAATGCGRQMGRDRRQNSVRRRRRISDRNASACSGWVIRARSRPVCSSSSSTSKPLCRTVCRASSGTRSPICSSVCGQHSHRGGLSQFGQHSGAGGIEQVGVLHVEHHRRVAGPPGIGPGVQSGQEAAGQRGLTDAGVPMDEQPRPPSRSSAGHPVRAPEGSMMPATATTRSSRACAVAPRGHPAPGRRRDRRQRRRSGAGRRGPARRPGWPAPRCRGSSDRRRCACARSGRGPVIAG